MFSLIVNLIIPQNISVEFKNNPLMCGLTIIVTKNDFHMAHSINKYELENMDDTSMCDIIKKLICRLLIEEQRRMRVEREIEKSNINSIDCEPVGEADKPLPMAPKYNVKRGALCPSCDGELDMRILRCGLFRRDEIKIREKAPFCKWCGQAIDWRND